MKLALRLPTDQENRRLLTHAGLAFSGFVVAWLLVAFLVFPDDGAAGVVTVPAVLGLTYDDASKRLGDSGLYHALGESRLSGEAPKSTVLAQTPAAGSRVLRRSKVTLDVSAGQERRTIPDVVGKSRLGAEAMLREAGLQLGSVTERSSAQARGTVLSSQPAIGQVVPAGTAVDLAVSTGPSELAMPDVIGYHVTAARGTLEQLGLTIWHVTFDSMSSAPAGRVLEQSPLAGTTVLPGAAITLKVAGKP